MRLSGHQYSPYNLLARTIRVGYATAVERMLAEAVALGADGVIGVRLEHRIRSVRELEQGIDEFTAAGTAVRARSRSRPSAPFSTDVGGADLAKLVQSGWIPVSVMIGVEVALRHVDAPTARLLQSNNRTNNVELETVSELVCAAQTSARNKFRAAMAQVGADGGLLTELRTTIASEACDFVTHVVATGTSIVRFGDANTPGPLSALSMKGPG